MKHCCPRKFPLWRASLGLAVVLLAGSCGAAPNESPLLDPAAQSRVARLLARRLPALHLTSPDWNPDYGARVFESFLEQLDRQRYFFLASDIEEFRHEAATIHQDLLDGDVSLAFRVFARFRERMEDRYAFAEAELADGPPHVEAEDFAWQRKDAAWPENREAWDEVWRLRLKNEWVGRVVAVRMADEFADDDTGPEEGADVEEDTEDGLDNPHMEPEEFVLHRHRQFSLVIHDSDDLWILEKFYNAFTRALDPHSEYLSPSRTEDFDINMRLSLYGIGALLSTEDGAARVVRVLPGGPAERDGRLGPGDRIIAVAQGDKDPVNVLHWPLYRTVRLIRGEKGTRVRLTVWPASDLSGAVERTIELVRDEVRLEERAAQSSVRKKVDDDDVSRALGVITLPDFYADFRGDSDEAEARRSARDVQRHIESLRERNVEGILLDLRNNGGGSLMDAVEIAGLFIESGPIVQVRDQRGVHRLNDPSEERVYDGPLVVLVNRMSASASEIVAAALQDYGRALVVGDSRTHGKGTVQSLLPLDRRRQELGSLKVTTAVFYRIAGGSTQVRGVTPDVVLPSPWDAMEIGEEYLPNALPWDSVPAAFYATLEGDVPPAAWAQTVSQERRAADPRHRQREELLGELKRLRRQERLPLCLDTRLEQARRERTLDRWQEHWLDYDESDPDEDAMPDLMLEEALFVLADIVAWREGESRSQARMPAGHRQTVGTAVSP